MVQNKRYIPFTILIMILMLDVGSCISAPGMTPVILTSSPTARRVTTSPTPTPIDTFTPPPTVTFTSSPIPTLSIENAYSMFEELFLNDGNCPLPCWWGLVPGVSTFQDAQATLAPLSGMATWNEVGVLKGMSRGHFYLSYPNETDDILLNIDFNTMPNKNEVSILYISSQVLRGERDREPVYDNKKYLELMGNYTLSSIFSTYGKPGQIGLTVARSAESYGPTSMYLRLLYPKRGIYVKYIAKAVISGDQISGCASKSFIEMWLVLPSSDISYWEQFFPDLDSDGTPLEEAIGISPDTFYQLFSEPTNRCLETPLSLWPGP